MAQVVATSSAWTVGQLVNVKPRTWAGINRPGGHGKITKVEGDGDDIRLTVKYVLGGSDKDLDPCLVEVPQELGTRERKRRTTTVAVVTESTTKPKSTTSDSGSTNRKKRPPTSKHHTVVAAAASKENTHNGKHSSPPRTVSRSNNQPKIGTAFPPQIHDTTSTKKPLSVIRRRRRPSTKKKSKKNAKHKWPTDLPSEIVIRHNIHGMLHSFTSPINDKGAEEGRKYLLPPTQRGGRASHHDSVPSPSTLFGHSSPYAGGSNHNMEEEHDDDEMMMDDMSESEVMKSRIPSFVEAKMPSAEDMKVVDRSSSGTAGRSNAGRPHNMMDASTTAGAVKRVTVQSVVDQEMKQAAEFVADMFQRPPAGGEDESKPPAAVAAANTTCPRQEELMDIFLRVMDHNEGTVEEDGLLSQINQQNNASMEDTGTPKEFQPAELQALMQTLVANNKIMRCENNIYWL